MKTIQSYTIKQASELSGLPESTLRYYETVGLINRINRDYSSKHRTYNEDDINLVVAIACLNATGMSIKDMRSYLKNRNNGIRGAKNQIELLQTQKKKLSEESRYLKLRQSYVDIKIDYWNTIASGDKKKAEIIKNKAAEIAKKLKLPKEK